ncbi:ArsA family ATPase [Pseudonocardiaceae bacterium YIM PH 21723]|nr:ArsA family ATPase [Pseudonocardiaceae bacterium YIM PH 21723]
MRVLLFTGKGGVGKTTLAAATAAHVAARGGKCLVVSTDPAHSLGDALGVPLTGVPSEVDGGLSGAQIDTRMLADGAWPGLREHLRRMLAGAGVDELAAEELTVLPGVEELLAIGEVHRMAAAGTWDTVIVDCGPTAETLRLLALPEALHGYLERLFPQHRRVVRGLLAGLAGSKDASGWDAAADAIGLLAEQLDALRALLTDASRTSVRLVFTPERVVLAETRRTITALALQDIQVDGLLGNRLLPKAGSARGPAAHWLRTRRAEQDAVLAELTQSTGLGLRQIPYLAHEPVGLPALRDLAAELYGEDDPVAATIKDDMLSVQRTGEGRDAEYRLRIAVPLPADADLDLARVGDELSVTVDGRRRVISLPAVLRRCAVTGASAGEHGLTVRFRPDPSKWMR